MKSTHAFTFRVLVMLSMVYISACKTKTNMDDTTQLADTDRYYSNLSVNEGMNAAFLAMFDSAGVMLKANHKPIEGHKAIEEILMNQNDSLFTLSWEPLFAKVATSGDLGYTYGTYKVIDKAGDTISGEGTYTTIWHKNSNGKWKALLDTGNPGLGKNK